MREHALKSALYCGYAPASRGEFIQLLQDNLGGVQVTACLHAHDLADLVALQPLEHDELVHAVDELRLEVPLHLRGPGQGLGFMVCIRTGGGPESGAVHFHLGALN